MGNKEKLDFTPQPSKDQNLAAIQSRIESFGFRVSSKDLKRPWGGFFCIDEDQTAKFIDTFFHGVDLSGPAQDTKRLSPKILYADPLQKLSWQVHERRSELWRIIHGPVGVYLSETDVQPKDPKVLIAGDVVNIPRQTRHSLAGLDLPGIVAEIWIHTDPNHASDEDDIRRISDMYGRTRE